MTSARRLFADQGFHATSTRDLAEAADINHALLYRYFPNKKAILLALVDDAITAFTRMPPIADIASMSIEAVLQSVGAGFVETVSDHLDLLTILISEHNTLADDTRFVEFIHRAATELGALLDRKAGPEASTSGYIAARSYMGSLVAFLLVQDILGLSATEPIEVSAYVRDLAKLTANGLTSGHTT